MDGSAWHNPLRTVKDVPNSASGAEVLPLQPIHCLAGTIVRYQQKQKVRNQKRRYVCLMLSLVYRSIARNALFRRVCNPTEWVWWLDRGQPRDAAAWLPYHPVGLRGWLRKSGLRRRWRDRRLKISMGGGEHRERKSVSSNAHSTDTLWRTRWENKGAEWPWGWRGEEGKVAWRTKWMRERCFTTRMSG